MEAEINKIKEKLGQIIKSDVALLQVLQSIVNMVYSKNVDGIFTKNSKVSADEEARKLCQAIENFMAMVKDRNVEIPPELTLDQIYVKIIHPVGIKFIKDPVR